MPRAPIGPTPEARYAQAVRGVLVGSVSGRPQLSVLRSDGTPRGVLVVFRLKHDANDDTRNVQDVTADRQVIQTLTLILKPKVYRNWDRSVDDDKWKGVVDFWDENSTATFHYEKR